MRTQWRAGLLLRALGLPLVLAGGLFGPGLSAPAAPAAPTAPCQSWTGVPPPGPGAEGNVLNGVAVVSACDAWAVGSASDGTSTQPLIEHWDGARWTVVPGPVFGGSFSTLRSVAAVSASDVWAVGSSTDVDSSGDQTLTEHWDGTRWAVVPSPDPGSSFNRLRAVTTDSAGHVWAVGDYSSGSGDQTLILVWTGTFWRQLPSPDPARDNTLTAVAATSASNVWAVGFTGLLAQTLILHWDGSTWTQVPSPNQGGTSAANSLTGVAATSSASAWAAGRSIVGTAHTALILYWNGTTWARVPAAHPGTTSDLFAVAAASASNAWTVGTYAGTGAAHPLALHCC
jgi:hypothetical protein